MESEMQNQPAVTGQAESEVQGSASRQDPARRQFLKSAGVAAVGAFATGKVLGANDRLNVAYVGMGRMGRGNLEISQRHKEIRVAAVCDVYQPHLEMAGALARKLGHSEVKEIADFRNILADKSIDAVCISTPDHWHAWQTVEACKAGKDVYVEKPISVTIEEGQKMVQAARKYNRVVQAGTMQRSGIHFQKACEIIKSGKLGKVATVKTWNVGVAKPEGIGNPADGAPPAGLDWDLWLGPAPKRAFNANRFGVDPKAFSHFRWFWDYAGGMMTDWGVHVLDIALMAFDNPMPEYVNATGGKFYLKDNRETPDTLLVTYKFPQGFVATYENRHTSSIAQFNKGYGTVFYGTEGTLHVDRSGYTIYPEKGSELLEAKVNSSNNMNYDHWGNFLECIRTRQRPISDIEVCHKSTATCLLANVAYRSGIRVDWDSANSTTVQPEARKYLSKEERDPWKIVL
jgi:predicted dehydrogenase